MESLEQSDGRGNVSSLHFQAGKHTMSSSTGVSHCENAERKSKHKTPKVKITEWEGPLNFRKHRVFAFWQRIKNQKTMHQSTNTSLCNLKTFAASGVFRFWL